MRYAQAVNLLEKDLREHKYSQGDKLPALRELSATMGMNHRTIRRGIEQLVQVGKLEVRPGVGVFVVDRSVRPKQKTTRIALGCRAYMFNAGKHHPMISAYLVGAHRRFSSADVSVQTMVYKGYNLAEEIGEAILAQGVDGFIACTGGLSTADVEFFAQHQIPLVYCGHMLLEHEWPVSFVQDIVTTLRQAVDHLRQLGHRRVAFIGWEKSADKGEIHRQFDRMVFDYQLGDVRDLHIQLPDDESQHWARIESFFDLSPAPTAVIVHDEFLADVLLAGCRRRKIDVPDNLSIVSLSDAAPFGHGLPLTAPDSVKINSDMLNAACDIMGRMINGESITRRVIRIVPEIVSKSSSGPAVSAAI
ncbi:MAG: substrate-binding domain-containing protein [Phycisphaerales bacterium]|nr:substrate-binding domain-containing protein [Phycisphaerales bacterium]